MPDTHLYPPEEPAEPLAPESSAPETAADSAADAADAAGAAAPAADMAAAPGADTDSAADAADAAGAAAPAADMAAAPGADTDSAADTADMAAAPGADTAGVDDTAEAADLPDDIDAREELAADEAAARRNARLQRALGVCVGAALLALCCGCVLLGSAFAVRAGRGAPARQSAGSGGTNAPAPAQPSTDLALQVHEVPREEDGYTTEYIARQLADSVVGILMYDGSGIDPVGGGSGIIMSEDGYIITNAHVVVGATGLTVVLHDDSRYAAKVLGYDEKTDLAVIRINAEGLVPAQFGDSDMVAVGERAIAIGNPGGLAGSVSQGIISGLEREITLTLSDGTAAVIRALQTDAAINPGNSGGPLLNAWGQVIGINSSKLVGTGYEGIGFAIPVNDAKPIIDDLIQYGYVHDRAVLGITVIALDAANGPANGLPSQGLYIASVMEYSDLVRHGVKAGDVILSANGVTMVDTEDLAEQLRLFHPGDTMTMEILHPYDGSVDTIEVLLLDPQAGS